MRDGICAEVTCPWWLLPTFDNPLRRWIHPAERILSPWVKPGETVLEPGCGMGYFTIPLARLVGSQGRVIAVDLQDRMLQGVAVRARRAGMSERIQAMRCESDRLGVVGPVDFAMAFWMVHEVSHREAFLAEILGVMKDQGRFLVAEPRVHVTAANFQRTLDIARSVGFQVVAAPKVGFSRAVVFAKS
ncbi:MAG: methyltransferase domain-containing protein [Fibrobacterota bacterium]|nr:methyltransferase domain-containing protein [Fibrobacterota bacterium]QQS06589.1 MAG: methyltransferase domain-containing protein [Fibrobacterota bacterium]